MEVFFSLLLGFILMSSANEVVDTSALGAPILPGVIQDGSVLPPSVVGRNRAAPSPTNGAVTPELLERFEEAGGNPQALAHLNCIMSTYVNEDAQFDLREARSWMRWRCNRNDEIQIERRDRAVLVDYTSPPDQRRYFEINFETQTVEAFYVGHGRNGNTDRGNRRSGGNRNTVQDPPTHFSNELNSNASSTGLFVAGRRYWGRWGSSIGRRSMVLHGLEREVNDRACDRSTVVHGSWGVHETGSTQGANRMSSGCPILNHNEVNERIEFARGEERGRGGAAYFVYGPREAELPADYYCQPNESVRLRATPDVGV